MPETVGDATTPCDPNDPASIAMAVLEAVGPHPAWVREQGLRRATLFTGAGTAAAMLDVYREVGERRRAGPR